MDLERPGVVFRCGQYIYRTTGKELGHGGMGTVFLMARKQTSGGNSHPVVGKVFHADYLLQLRTDAVAKRDHECVMKNLEGIARLNHPHVLPIFVSTRIADNFLTVTPLRAATLREAIARGTLSSRRKVELLMQAISGLSAMHEAGYLHRDFTVRNILVNEASDTAALFDFDLSLPISEVKGQDYKTRFQGRIFGSPGYSLAPEVLNSSLMSSPINSSLDIYAVGTSLFALFTEQLPYAEAEDMWSLLLQVGEGVVKGGRSFIPYPDSVPKIVRPVIELCMERTPSLRPQKAEEVIDILRELLPKLQPDRRRTASLKRTIGYGDRQTRLRSIGDERQDGSVESDLIAETDKLLLKHGYQMRRALGRIKGHAIFMAVPDPELVAAGRFPDVNPYPKIVTVLELASAQDPQSLVEAWITRYQPKLRLARQGLLTTLHRVVHDDDAGLLLLLSEFVDDARFGPSLDDHVLSLEEGFGLGYLVARQVCRLHENELAHNNVCAQALLLKGDRMNRKVLPAMVGIVEPSESRTDMGHDVKNLATLALGWIHEDAIAGSDPIVCARLEVLYSDLQTIASEDDATIAEMLEICEDALSALNFNFGVLRENGGDLQDQALLLVGHSLYGRLWK